MTATTLTKPPLRRRSSSRWWIALAAVGLLPSLLPLATLVVTTLTDGAVNTVPLDRLLQLLVNTIVLAVAVTVSATVLGVSTAWLVARTSIPLRRTFSVLVALPLVMPSYVVALTLLGASGQEGVLSGLATRVGLSPLPSPGGFAGSWLALTVFAVPYVHLALVPAVRSIDPALEEASRSLGASKRTTFRRVILPMLRPATAASSLLVALYTISDFGVVSLFRYDTFTRSIYAQYQGRLDRRPALTLALVLIVVAFVVVWAERRTRGRARYETRSPRPQSVIRLTPAATAAALAFLTTLAAVSVALPVGVLGTWLTRGIRGGEDLGSIAAEAFRSFGLSGLAALATVAVAVPVAYVIVRGPSRVGALAETTVWMSYALPHIALGLAMVTFALGFAPFSYQTVGLVVVAYVAMFLPQAVGAASDSLRRISPSLEDASRSLGRSGLATTWRVMLPLMRPGLLAGGSLVFLTSMKELPATLLLRPNEFETLAIRIWAATGEGFYTRASAAALVLLAVSAIPLTLVNIRDLAR